LRHSLPLALALGLAPLAWGSLSVKDTVVMGVPSVRLMEGEGWEGELKIDSERGEPRASLEGSKDSVLVVFDRNPFARMAGRTRPLSHPPRVTKSRLVLPKWATADLFRRLGVVRLASASKPKPETSAKPVTRPEPPQVALPAAPPPVSPAPPSLDPPDAPDVPDSADAATSPSPTESTAVAAAHAPSVPEVASPTPPRKGTFTVVIDAGHGGKDPGASGKRSDETQVLEKMATLQIARKLRDQLNGRKDIHVVMTRDQDVFVELAERTHRANAAKGDLFVSLHCNSLPTNSKRREEVDGFMVYLLREAKDESDRAIERRENEAIRYETGERQKKEALSPVEWMMLEHQLNQYTKESERFAGLVVRKLQSEGPVTKERTGAGQAGFFVLVGALMPSVLVEMGYLSNASDADALSDTDRQERVARGIADAIESFKASRR